MKIVKIRTKNGNVFDAIGNVEFTDKAGNIIKDGYRVVGSCLCFLPEEVDVLIPK